MIVTGLDQPPDIAGSPRAARALLAIVRTAHEQQETLAAKARASESTTEATAKQIREVHEAA